MVTVYINENKVLNLNGYDQHLTITGIDSTNQVILFLHGGPGNPVNNGHHNVPYHHR